MSFFFLIAFLFTCQICLMNCQDCKVLTEKKERMNQYLYEPGTACWQIIAPEDSFITLNISRFDQESDCAANLQINISETKKFHNICYKSQIQNPYTSNSSITFSFTRRESSRISSTFMVFSYSIETKVFDKNEITEARKTALSWLLKRRTSSWGWKENTLRAIVALYLSAAANYTGTNLKEELMVKQAELEVLSSFRKSHRPSTELSMSLHALLVVCHDPRQFYGYNLVRELKEQVEKTNTSTHPLSYLALCNANETWPQKAVQELKDVLKSGSKYPFAPDLQALAHLAFSCALNNTNRIATFNQYEINLYKNATDLFKRLQSQKGGFGNAYTTALITQALVASGQEAQKDWSYKKAVRYLMKELNSPALDFLTVYFTLPILNEKTLAEVWKRDCSQNNRKQDPIPDITDDLENMFHVKYSLYIGNDWEHKRSLYTFSSLVSNNTTAFEVMKLAGDRDTSFRFKWIELPSQKYIYEISNISNDPEHGKFWILYITSFNGSDYTWEQPNSGPDDVVLEENDHLIMWYRTVTL